MTTNDATTLEALISENLPPGVSMDAEPNARRPFSPYNVIGTFTDNAAARRALVAEESDGTSAGKLAMMVLGGQPVAAPGTLTPPTGRPPGVEPGVTDSDPRAARVPAVGPDPEGVAGDTARRIVPGALIGLVVGAVVIAVLAGLVGDLNGGQLAAAAIGGGILVAAIGGLIGAFWGFGDSDAYRHTFTDLRGGVTLIAAYADRAAEARDVASRFTDAGASQVWTVDARGHRITS